MDRGYLKLAFAVLLFYAAISYIINTSKNSKKTEKISVKILQTIEHPGLDATRRGIASYLKTCCNIVADYETAQGSRALALEFANRFCISDAKVLIGIGTVASQALHSCHERPPVVFSSVIDPIAAGLVKNLLSPDEGFTGVSNMSPIKPQLQFFKRLMPNLKNIGMLYNVSEINSVGLLKAVQRYAAQMDMNVISYPVSNGRDIIISAKEIVKSVDAIFIANDNIVIAYLQGIIKIAEDAKKPVFCSYIDTLNMGVVAAVGASQYKIGEETGKIAEKILSGIDVSNIPVIFPKTQEIAVNLSAAKRIGMEIPDSILRTATIVIE